MLCRVCRGSGNVGVHPNWWMCPCCGGCGVTIQYAPPTMQVQPIRYDFWRKQSLKSAQKAALRKDADLA
jgi:hypothetical protein